MTASMTLEEKPSDKPVTPKRMDLEIDKEPEPNCEVENDAQVEAKKMKKKKEKVKRENMHSRIFYSNRNLFQPGLDLMFCTFMHVCV